MISLFTTSGNELFYRFDAETVCIEPWNLNSLRVRAVKQAEFPQGNSALIEKAALKAQITIAEDTASIENGKLKAVISKDGKLSFYNHHGKLLLEEYVRNRANFSAPIISALKIDGRKYIPHTGGDYKIEVHFESLDPNEKIFGMGQYQQPWLNLKGTDLELAQRNSQASVPFLISSLGYGFLWNNPAVGRACFGKNYTTWSADSTKGIDYLVIAGDSPVEIEEAYAKAAGTVPMMPDYAMGFWQCKLRYQTQDELLSVAREYKKRGLPLSVIVIDYFHWTCEGDWKFDPDYWPDPEAMVKELSDMGIKAMVSVWPTVDRKSENYQEMTAKGYLVRSERGIRAVMDYGTVSFFDATNPGARTYLWEKIKANYYDKGISLFWLDLAEPEYETYDFDNYRYYLGPNLQVGNMYPVLYAKTFYDGIKAGGQENVISLLRCAWAGSQRYGALVWSGDIQSSFDSLRNQFAAGLNMGIAGIPWWTTDIGGFHGADIRSPAFHELFIRWFEWGCFCPVMRLHGDRFPHKPPLGKTGGGFIGSGADNEVWSFGDEVYEICKKYLFLREKLKPYIKEQMKAAHEKGSPVMRPLFYDFPEDAETWEIEDQYMFGPNYLVAPIFYDKARERQVYFPAGLIWTNCWTGDKIEGSNTVKIEAPIDRIPVFSKDGSRFEEHG
jgi:alpha-D-xyloside xylohydrolase